MNKKDIIRYLLFLIIGILIGTSINFQNKVNVEPANLAPSDVQKMMEVETIELAHGKLQIVVNNIKTEEFNFLYDKGYVKAEYIIKSNVTFIDENGESLVLNSENLLTKYNLFELDKLSINYPIDENIDIKLFSKLYVNLNFFGENEEYAKHQYTIPVELNVQS